MAVKISRRGFLRGAGAAVFGFPYIIPASVLGKGGVLAPSEKIVMAAIGVGSMGTGDLRGFLNKADQVKVVAVCDVDLRHAQNAKNLVDKKYGNRDCRIYQDYRELLEKENLDAVCHALPDHWHAIVSVACAKKGLHIFGQKPLARTITEGRAICDAVKRYNVIWQTGSWQRSVWQFHRACELVINGRIGKVSRVEVGLPDGHKFQAYKPLKVPKELDYEMWLGPAPWRPYMDFGRGGCHWDWRWIMDYSGGQLTDWAGHHIDIAHWGLGLDYTGPVEIEGKGEYPGDGIYDTPYAYKIQCRYANGIEMTIANKSQLPKGMGTVWYGDKGWIHVSRRGIWASDKRILEEKISPSEKRLYLSRDHKQNFLDCIRNQTETITPAEVAHRSISVGLLGETAMLTGQKLKWDPEKERFTNSEIANRYLGRPFRSPWHI